MSDVNEEGPTPSKRQRVEGSSGADSSTGADAVAEDAAETVDGGGTESGAKAVAYIEPELGERMRKVMLCTVCLELPHPDESYQCNLGHIVCEDCVTRLLAEAALKKMNAYCPHCRTHISWQALTQNLAVDQMLWELPKTCANCEQPVENKHLAKHLKSECSRRMVKCQYRCLGCIWTGWQEDSAEHEANCEHLEMTGEELLSRLADFDKRENVISQPLSLCLRQLSAQRISYKDLTLHWPQQSLFSSMEVRFRSSHITVFEETWHLHVKLLYDSQHADPQLVYSLKLLTTPSVPLRISYFATLPAIHVSTKQLTDIKPQLFSKIFNNVGQNTEFKELPMSNPIAIYRLLSMPHIDLRIWMFLN